MKNNINHKRRSINGLLWSAPVVTAIALPLHAQATVTPMPTPGSLTCSEQLDLTPVISWTIAGFTTTDNWFGTEFPATWGIVLSAVTLTITGEDVMLDIDYQAIRTSAPTGFSAWGRSVHTGTIDKNTGLVSITNLGPPVDSVVRPAGGQRPAHYIPASPFSFTIPCDGSLVDGSAAPLTVAYSADYSQGNGTFDNVYTWELA